MSAPIFKVGDKATRFDHGNGPAPAYVRFERVIAVATITRVGKTIGTDDGHQWKSWSDVWRGRTFATSGYLRPYRPEDIALLEIAKGRETVVALEKDRRELARHAERLREEGHERFRKAETADEMVRAKDVGIAALKERIAELEGGGK